MVSYYPASGCSDENSREAHRLYAELLSKLQNPMPQIIHQSSLATEWIWVLCSTGIWSQNRCAKTCSCWKYRCSPCLENLPISNQRVQALIPLHNRASAVFCQWILEKHVVNTQFVGNILFTGMRDSQGTVWSSFLIPICGRMTVPTPSWHQAITAELPSMPGWASEMITS
jgi:hypothetical protein